MSSKKRKQIEHQKEIKEGRKEERKGKWRGREGRGNKRKGKEKMGKEMKGKEKEILGINLTKHMKDPYVGNYKILMKKNQRPFK